MYDVLPVAVDITMVPFLALLLGLATREKGRFVANLVLSLHIHAVAYSFAGIGRLFGAGTITGVVGGTVYMGAALRRITAESIRSVLAPCLLVLLAYPFP